MAENSAEPQQTMSQGVIDGASETLQVHWKVPDYFSLDLDENRYIESPPFAFAGCKWILAVHPKGDDMNGYMSAYLCMTGSNTVVRNVKFSIAMKNASEDDIVIHEAHIDQHTFSEEDPKWGLPAFLNLRNIQYRWACATGSAVTFTCCMARDIDATPEEAASNSEKVDTKRRTLVGLDTLSSDFKDLLSSDWKCDVTINVKGKKYWAHRTVLAARSTVFRAMYEHDTSEAKNGVLEIPDCDPESFGDFISFLYTGRLELDSYPAAYSLFITADKYDVQQLKSFCSDYLKQNLATDNFPEIAVLADMHSDDSLMSSAQAFFNKNYKKILRMSNWKALLENSPRLANILLGEMASATEKST